MRLRWMRLEEGGRTTAVHDDERDRWVGIAPALDAVADRSLETVLGPARTDLVAFLAAGERAREAARDLLARTSKPARLDPAPLLPFVPRSFRDFSIWERHMIDAARGIAREFMPPALGAAASAFERATGRTFPPLKPRSGFYEHPAFYVGNHLAFYGDGDVVPYPKQSQWFDFELELGFVLAHAVHDADPATAEAAIGGFFVLNDWSARDIQAHDYRTHPFTQVAKAKATANSIGTEVVTADEILPRWRSLTATAEVNGETWARSTTAGAIHDLGAMVAYASQDEFLVSHEVLATGTVPGCCGLEVGRRLNPGDEVELTLSGLGTLRNRVARTREPVPAPPAAAA